MPVLVVEDDPDIRCCLVDSLVSWGFTVEAVLRASQPVDKAAAQRFRGIILGVHAPGSKGLEMIREWHAVAGGAPLIVLSGDVLTQQECIRLGVSAVLPKPFNRDELRQAAETWLSGRP